MTQLASAQFALGQDCGRSPCSHRTMDRTRRANERSGNDPSADAQQSHRDARRITTTAKRRVLGRMVAAGQELLPGPTSYSAHQGGDSPVDAATSTGRATYRSGNIFANAVALGASKVMMYGLSG